MTAFEFYASVLINASAGVSLIAYEPIFSKWYFRYVCYLIVLSTAYFAGLHGGVLK